VVSSSRYFDQARDQLQKCHKDDNVLLTSSMSWAFFASSAALESSAEAFCDWAAFFVAAAALRGISTDL
jgi:hypothetical protein